jgi:hypothetical protein
VRKAGFLHVAIQPRYALCGDGFGSTEIRGRGVSKRLPWERIHGKLALAGAQAADVEIDMVADGIDLKGVAVVWSAMSATALEGVHCPLWPTCLAKGRETTEIGSPHQ